MREIHRKFVLCADDFAITEGVSRAMLALVDAGRLTAVSAMASMPAWRELAPELIARRGQVAIGLHLDLTLRPFAGKERPFDFRRLAVASLVGRIDMTAVSDEFERQFDLFETTLGVSPDHVDGHHHVHALRQTRVALLNVLTKRYGRRPPELRPLVRDPADAIFRVLRRRFARAKAFTVARLCAGFGARATAAGFATNIGFSGFSRFDRARSFDREFYEFLRAPGPRHLVMCHPGLADAALAGLDPVAARRDDEYASLMDNADLPNALLRVRRPRHDVSCAFAAWSMR